jgi:hypothetical protein
MAATTLERIDKASRLLIDGRLIVTRVMWERVDATCRGDSGEIWKLGYIGGHWHCECPAKTTCAHLKALMRVTVKPTGKKPQ